MSKFEVVIHEYTNTKIGHVNVEFKKDGVSAGFYGRNVDPDNSSWHEKVGKVFNETENSLKRIKDSPNAHYATILTITEQDYRQALGFSLREASKPFTKAGYEVATNKVCVSFVNDVLALANPQERNASALAQVGQYLKGNTLPACGRSRCSIGQTNLP